MLHGNLIARDESPISVEQHTSGGAAGDYIVIPDTHLLFHAEFKRVGNDLKLIGQDGKTFVVSDYFKSEHRLKLVSKEGAGLTGDVVEALAGPANAGQYAQATAPAQAAELVGKIVAVSGSAQIVRNGVAITANTGDAVLKGDVVQTGTGGQLSIIFTDSTTFNLSADARMVINEFVYDPNGSANATLINLVQGTIGFVAGQVAKTGDMKVKTPVATMGIRGTAVVVDISSNDGVTKFSVVVEPSGIVGEYNLYDNVSGALLGTVSNSSVGWVVRPVSPTEVFAQQLTKSAEDIQKEVAIISLVFQNQSTGQQLLNFTDPNSTKVASVFTQFVVSDRLGINPGDPLGKPTTYTINAGTPVEVAPKTNNDGTPFINHPPVARPDGEAQADFAQVNEKGVGPGNTTFDGTPAFTGNLLFNDSDPDGDVIVVSSISTVSARLHAFSLTVLSNGDYTYTLDNNDAEVQALAKGETITDVYRYTIRDPYGATAEATLTVTIIGTNDQPVINVDPGTHSINEGVGTNDPASVKATVQGTLTFGDVDLSDTHTVTGAVLHVGVATFSGTGPIPVASLAALNTALTASILTGMSGEDSTGTGAGKIHWSFAIAEQLLDFIGVGQTVTAIYDITITDTNGATATQQVTLVIHGTNDDQNSYPRVVTVDAGGAITESGTLSDSGPIVFADVDLNDHILVSHNAASTPSIAWSRGALSIDQEAALRGGFSINQTAYGNSGTVTWTYERAETDLDFLAAGETVTLAVTVTIDDQHSGATQQVVTITITGTNDRPVITAVDVAGAVTEDAASSLTETGTVTFADLDQTDHETASIGFVSATASTGASVSGALDTALQSALTLAASGFSSNSGTVTWNFALNNSLVQYLADGETVTATYTITVTDDSGVAGSKASAPQTVTVIITGTNDRPVITAVDVAGAVTEDAASSLTETGTVTFADLDQTDHETASTGFVSATPSTGASVSGALNTALQSALTLVASDFASNNGTVTWNFALDNALVQYLARGETVTATYTITVTDDSGVAGSKVSVPQTVTVTITGTNDAPVITSSAATATISERLEANEVPGGTITANGTFEFTDADITDAAHVASVQSVTPSGTTAGLALDNDLLKALLTFDQMSTTTTSADGSFRWTFTGSDANFDYLGVGDTLTLTYTVLLTDDEGATGTRTVTVNIAGTNDAPVILSAAATANISELAEANEVPGGTITANGTFEFTDADITDAAHVASVQSVTPSGTTTGLALDNDALKALLTFDQMVSLASWGDGSFRWTFTGLDSSFDYLGVGDTLALTYTVLLTDDEGATGTKTVTVTIAGTNDAPVITSSAATATISERLEANEVPGGTITANGTFEFTDADITDAAHVASVQSVTPSGTTAGLALDNDLLKALLTFDQMSTTTTSADGSFRWTFTGSDANFDYLGVGDTLTLTYTVLLTDDEGATGTRTVTVNIAGTNDAPVILSAAATANISELAEANEVPGGTITANGTFEFTDADITDAAHVASVQSVTPSGTTTGLALDNDALKALLTFDQMVSLASWGDGSFRWTFTGLDSSFDYLGVGDTLALTYTVLLTDDEGATGTKTVTVTIAGTNDAPVITGATNAPAQTEAIDASVQNIAPITGTLVVTDADVGDSLTGVVSANGVAKFNGSTTLPAGVDVAALGLTSAISFNTVITDGGSKSLTWTYEPVAVNLDFLDHNDVLTIEFIALLNDGNGNVGSQLLTVTINGRNDAPVATVANNGNVSLSAINEDTPVGDNDGQTVTSVVGSSFTDLDTGASLVGIAVAGNTADATTQGSWQFWCDGTGYWLNIGAVSTIAALALSADTLIRFKPVLDYNGAPPALLVYGLDDTYGGLFTYSSGGGHPVRQTIDVTTRGDETPISQDPLNIGITVNSVNDAPDSSDTSAAIDEDTTYTFLATDFAIVDSHDNPANELIKVKISTLPTFGKLFLNDVEITSAGTLVAIGDIEDGKLVFDPGHDNNGAADFTFQIQDDGGTLRDGVDLDPDASTFTITVTPVNDAPVNTVPAAQSVNEDSNLTITGLSVNDVDADNVVTVTLSVAHGTITVSTAVAGGLSAGDIEGNGTASVQLTQYQSKINATLAAPLNGVVYRGDLNFTGSDTLTVTTSDNGNTGSGGTQTDIDTVAIAVVAVNDAPVHVVPEAQTVGEDNALVFSSANGNAISISDVDIGADGLARIALTVTNGTLTLASLTGLSSFSGGDGTADATMTFSGTLSDVNNALNGLRFDPAANFNGGATLTISTHDNGLTGIDPGLTGGTSNEEDIDTIAITVTAVNDAPVNTVPVAQIVNEDTDLSITGLSIADIDAVGGTVTTTLLVSFANGKITLATTTGLSVTGNGTYAVSLTGTVADINAALAASDNVIYRGNQDFTGSDSLTVHTTDNGNTGAGGALIDSDTVSITVVRVNDTPIATDDALSSVAEDSGVRIISFDSLLGNDSTGPANEFDQTLTITALSNIVGGTAIINGTNIQFTPTANFNGTASFDYTISDNGRTYLSDDFKTDVGHVSFDVTAVNDAPVNTVPVAQIVNEDTDLSITGLSIADIDAVGGTVTTTLLVSFANGKITLATTTGLSVTGNGTYAVSLTGTVADINAALAASDNVIYRGNQDFTGSDSLTVHTTDNGNTGAGGALIDSDTVSITVVRVNDTPIATDDALSSVAEDSGVRIISFDSLLGNDSTGPANEFDQTLTITALSNIVGGTAIINGTNIQFTPTANFNGTASFDYTVSDNGRTYLSDDFKTDVGHVSFDITAVNDAPVATGETLTGNVAGFSYNAANGHWYKVNTAETSWTAAKVAAAAAGGYLATITSAAENAFVASLVNASTKQYAWTGGTDAASEGQWVWDAGPEVGNLFWTGNVSGSAPAGVYENWENDANDSALYVEPNGGAAESAMYIRKTGEWVDYPASGADLLASVIEVSFVEDKVSVIPAAFLLANDTDIDNANNDNTGLSISSVTATGNTHGAVVLLSNGNVQYTPQSNYNGPVSFSYTVNDTATGVSNTATATFTVEAVNDAPVVVAPGRVLTLDGVNDRMVVANETNFDVTSSFTLEAWITADGPGSGGNNLGGIIFNKEMSYELARFSDGSIRYAIQEQGGSEWVFVNTGYVVPEGARTHIAFTFDATAHQAHLYVDGVLMHAAVNNIAAIEPSNYPLLIGGRSLNEQHFDGQIDDARVWNVARSGTEIAANYNSQLTGNESGLVGYWTFDDLSNPGRDTTGHGNTGTLQNGATTGITVIEDTPTKLTGISVSDIDAGAADLTLTLALPAGTHTLSATSGGGVTVGGSATALTLTGTVASINAFLASASAGVTYTPIANSNDDVTLTVTASDNGATGSGGALSSASQSVLLDIIPANDAPAFASLDNTPTYTENGAAVVLDGDALVSDLELDAANNYNGARLKLVAENAFDSFGSTGTLSFDSGAVLLGGLNVGSISNSLGILEITFNSDATGARVDSVLQQITYFNGSDTPPATVTVSYIFNDGNTGGQGAGGEKTATGPITVNITAVNDAPVLYLNAGDPQNVETNYSSPLLNDGNPFPIAVSPSVSDVDNTTMQGATVVLTTGGKIGDFFFVPLGSGNSGQLGSGISWEITGTPGDSGDPLTVTFSGNFSSADYADAIQQVKFGTTSSVIGDRHIAVSVNDGTDNSNEATATINVQADDNQAPQSSGDFVIISSAAFHPADGVFPNPYFGWSEANFHFLLANDSDPDGDPIHLSGVTAGDEFGTPQLYQADQPVYQLNGESVLPGPGYRDGGGFSYTVSDGTGDSSPSFAYITIVNYDASHDETLFGGTGDAYDDIIFGADEVADRIDGLTGNDILVGGISTTGAAGDTFLFTPDFGKDTIVGFDHGYDKIDLSALNVPADLIEFQTWFDSHVASSGDTVTVTYDPGNTISIYDPRQGFTVTANDFILPHPT